MIVRVILSTRLFEMTNAFNRLFVKSNRQYFALVSDVSLQILRTRKATYKVGVAEKDRNKSFMDILLRMHMDEGIFTEDEIREEVNTFMIGVSVHHKVYVLYRLVI